MPVPKGVFDSRFITEQQIVDAGLDPDIYMSHEAMGGYEFVRSHIARMLGYRGRIVVRTYDLSGRTPENITDEALAWFEDEIKASTLSFVYDKLVIIDAAASRDDLGMVYRGRNDGLEFDAGAVIRDLHRFAGEERHYGPVELAQRGFSDLTETESYPRQFRSEDVVDLYANDDKATKRAKTEARPFRTFALDKRPLKVWVEDFGEIGNIARDGLIAVNKRLFDMAVQNTHLGKFDQVVGAALRFYLAGVPGWNGRAWGYLEVHNNTSDEVKELLEAEDMLNPHTGQILAMAKGNFIVVETEEDWDLRLATPCLGSQMYSTKVWYALGLEPQTAKGAVTDGQTTVNFKAMIDDDYVAEIMNDDAEREFEETITGQKMTDVAELTDNRFTTAGAWDEARKDIEFRWAVRNWILHGADYRWSPWLTQSIGTTWLGRLQLDDDTKFRIRLPNGMRAQIISISSAIMDPEVAAEIAQVKTWPKYGIMWSEKLKMGIVTDDDWIYTVVPSHGGCDEDDFFLLQQRTLTADRHYLSEEDDAVEFHEGDRVVLVTRNPNHRHEYTLWRPIEGHFPTWVWHKHNGDQIVYPPITNNNWPTQIITASDDPPAGTGEIELLDLPSTLGGGATRDDDKDAVEEWRVEIRDHLFDLAKKGIRIDRTMAKRIKRPKDPTKPMRGRNKETLKGTEKETSRRLKVMHSVKGHYEKRLKRWTQSRLEDPDPQVPPWLNTIVAQLTPQLKDMAANYVSRVRAAQGEANSQTQDIVDEYGQGVQLNIRQIQEQVLVPMFDKPHWSRFDLNMLALAMWRSTLIRKTITTQQYTDQVIMGTFVLENLTEALYMIGIGSRIEIRHGALERVQDVKWMGPEEPSQWKTRCVDCGDWFLRKSITSLGMYWNNNQRCNSCAGHIAPAAS